MAEDPSASAFLRWLAAEMKTGEGVRIGAGYQAVVHRYSGPFGDIVVKSPHERGLLAYLGRLALRREQRVYERLRGVPGIPRFFGLLDGRHLVLEHVAGPSLRAHESQLADRERFFADLLATLDAMHAAGVAHGDLKRKDNLIVGPGERPYLIDFGIAALAPAGAPRRGWVFALRAQMDLNAWTKLKYGHGRAPTSPEDAARYRPLLLERVARVIRIAWQKVTLRRLRAQWRAKRRG